MSTQPTNFGWGRTQGVATAVKTSTVITEAVKERAKPKQQAKEDTRFAEIKANPFYSVVFNEAFDEEQKAKEIASLLTVDKVDEFLLFDEWLANTRQDMSSELIALNDAEATSILQTVLDQMGNDLLDFEKQAKPFTDILEAVYTLRTNNITLDSIAQIKEKQEKQSAIESQIEDVKQQLSRIKTSATNLIEDNEVQRNDTNFLGNIKKSALAKIAVNNTRLTTLKEEIEPLTIKHTELVNQLAELNDTSNEQFAAEKEQLKNLLDVKGPEHKERSEALKKSAQKFIATSQDKVGTVRGHLTSREEQIARFKKANKNLAMVYAIIDDGVTRAFSAQRDESSKLGTASVDEFILSRTKREQKKEQIDQSVKTLETVKHKTLEAYASVAREGVTVNSMKETTDRAISAVRGIHTQGIAEVASNMSVMLEGIAGAALGEASAAAQSTLDRMNRTTNAITQKEVIKSAMAVGDTVSQVNKAMDSLVEIADTLSTAKEIYTEGLSALRGASNDLRDKAREVIRNTQEVAAVNSSLDSPETKVKANKTSDNPLGI